MAQANRAVTKTYVKFGKKPAKRDDRNLKFAAILKAPVTVPSEYDFDVQHHGVPTPMFGNDVYGDCVMAGRGHQTLRFELIEQNKIIKITDQDVTKEYFNETGGGDDGLVVLDSLKEWRSQGWVVDSRNYKIKAFAQVEPTSRQQIKRAVFMDIGIGLGFTLPDSAITQIHAGKRWEVVSGPGSGLIQKMATMFTSQVIPPLDRCVLLGAASNR